eukprot:579936-Prymnesium_polylepis.1
MQAQSKLASQVRVLGLYALVRLDRQPKEIGIQKRLEGCGRERARSKQCFDPKGIAFLHHPICLRR